LDPEDIKILSLEAICNFGKGTGLSWADIRLWGTMGPYIKPRCIGTVRVQTHCKYIYEYIYLLMLVVDGGYKNINLFSFTIIHATCRQTVRSIYSNNCSIITCFGLLLRPSSGWNSAKKK
jgi:hypothetical protein